MLGSPERSRQLPAQGRERLTEPYVTTRAKGTGLGLAREPVHPTAVVTEHAQVYRARVQLRLKLEAETRAGARSEAAHSTSTRPAAGVPASGARPAGDAQLASRVMERHAQLGRLNHFELLGVAETASSEAIRAAYERNARSFHPDLLRGAYDHLSPLAKEIYCRIQAAYAVLQNEQSRMQYLLAQARRPRSRDRRSQGAPGGARRSRRSRGLRPRVP